MSAAEVKARLRPFGISFEKSLEDLIKGIRACNNDTEKLTKFLDASIQECKTELKSSDMELKSIAILKLAYLEMYGFDMSWCSFQILEVMSSSKFQHKRIGYLAAIQILQRQNNDDALMLMTNLLKKDLNSVHFVDTSLAISGIASVVSKELAMDICDDMAKMLSHSKPLIRKKAVLAMYKIFLKYPEALRAYFDRIVDKLDDSDISVVSATVNVICELADANPSNYVELAPRLFGLMKESNNNWMVIRLLKLFSSLSLTEPRLKYKLLPEIRELMVTTEALSLVYECINSILNGNMLGPDDIEIAQIIVDKLLIFFDSDDHNLKYVGLLAFVKTCKIHKDLIKRHDKIILTCIYDDDLTIRETSLEIVNSLVTEKNIIAIVTRLLVQLIPYNEQQKRLDDINKNLRELGGSSHIGQQQQPIVVSDSYKYSLILKIIQICSMDNYSNIPNFRWYLGVLRDIIRLNVDNKIANVDKIITEQFIDMSIRVPSIRSGLIDACLELCVVPEKSEDELLLFRKGLKNCIWIIGEYYVDYIETQDSDSDSDSDSEIEEHKMLKKAKYSAAEIVGFISKQTILQRLGNMNFDDTVPTYIQSIAKLFSKYCVTLGDSNWTSSHFETVLSLCKSVIGWLSNFQYSANFEIQERALSFIEILRLVQEALESEVESLKESGDHSSSPPYFLVKGYNQLFDLIKMKPISKTLQYKVAAPSDLDLETAISDQAMVDFINVYNKLRKDESAILYSDGESEDEDESEYKNYFNASVPDSSDEGGEDEEIRKKKERMEKLKDDPFYISFDDYTKETLINSNEATEVPRKSKKKPSKPKKIKKEKVLVLEEEEDDDGDDANRIIRSTVIKKDKSSKFLIDASRLANVDLKEKGESENNEEYNVEDEVERLRKEFEASARFDVVDNANKIKKPKKIKTSIQSNNEVSITRKKPKKKAKKKVAIIE